MVLHSCVDHPGTYLSPSLVRHMRLSTMLASCASKRIGTTRKCDMFTLTRMPFSNLADVPKPNPNPNLNPNRNPNTNTDSNPNPDRNPELSLPLTCSRLTRRLRWRRGCPRRRPCGSGRRSWSRPTSSSCCRRSPTHIFGTVTSHGARDGQVINTLLDIWTL